MSRMESINQILRTMQHSSPDVEACAIISDDGLMIASALPAHIDEGRVSGMTATLSSLGARAARELERGEVQEVLVRGKDGYVVMESAGRGIVLLVLATKDAKLGLLFLDMRRAIEELARVL